MPGEGGAIIFVESPRARAERGAPQVYGEIAGYGATNDAHHCGKPAPDGAQFARAMQRRPRGRRRRARTTSTSSSPTRAGVPEWDAIEAEAIKDVFGKRARRCPSRRPKTMVGRLYAGGASLDAATALLAMRDGVHPARRSTSTSPRRAAT